MNNKEFYELVTTDLLKDIPEDKVPRLDHYLITLWQLASQSGKRKPKMEDFVGWLKEAVNAQPQKFDPQWLQRTTEFAESAYEEWENTVLEQISQLQEIYEEVGVDDLENHYGKEGWYNYRLRNYLKFATIGFFGGDEEDTDDPYEIEECPWQDFADFLDMGKSYN